METKNSAKESAKIANSAIELNNNPALSFLDDIDISAGYSPSRETAPRFSIETASESEKVFIAKVLISNEKNVKLANGGAIGRFVRPNPIFPDIIELAKGDKVTYKESKSKAEKSGIISGFDVPASSNSFVIGNATYYFATARAIIDNGDKISVFKLTK